MKKLLFLITLLFYTGTVLASPKDSLSKSTVQLLEQVESITENIKTSAEDAVNKVDTTKLYQVVYSDIKSALAALGDSLKVGSEYVYEILIKQQFVNSFTYLVFLIISLLFGLFFFKGLFNKEELWLTEDKYDPNPTIIGIIRWVLGVSGLIFFIIFLHNMNDCITGFINPEYGALNEIVNMIKKLK